MELINNKKDISEAMLEQYKLYVEMADKISERRGNVNSFFVTVHTVVLGIVGINGFNVEKYWWVIVVLGCLLCYVWIYLLQSYKLLNAGKFEIIHEIEKELPLNLYAYEWEKLDYGKNRFKYWPISHLERLVPVCVLIIYVSIFVCTLLEK